MENNNSEKSPSIAWVTGAGKGIGKEITIQLINQGWLVAASSRSNDDLQKLLELCPPKTLFTYPLDITDLKKTSATIEKIEGTLGKISLAILNAGTYQPISIENFSVNTFRLLVETNLMGTVNCLAQIIPCFIKRKHGQIIIISSLAGYRGLPTSAAYGATKAALINMCEALKPEFDQYNIDLTLVNPGFVKTPLTDKNTFYMPFLLSPKEAASLILSGAKKKKFEITFPFGFAIFMKLLRILPYKLYFFLTQWMIQDGQQKK